MVYSSIESSTSWMAAFALTERTDSINLSFTMAVLAVTSLALSQFLIRIKLETVTLCRQFLLSVLISLRVLNALSEDALLDGMVNKN